MSDIENDRAYFPDLLSIVDKSFETVHSTYRTWDLVFLWHNRVGNLANIFQSLIPTQFPTNEILIYLVISDINYRVQPRKTAVDRSWDHSSRNDTVRILIVGVRK